MCTQIPRVVVYSPVPGKELETFSLPTATAAGTRRRDFTLELGKNYRHHFCYDVASDNIIAFNNGRELLHLLALETDVSANSALSSEPLDLFPQVSNLVRN